MTAENNGDARLLTGHETRDTGPEKRRREMETSIFLAKLLGAYLVIIGVGILCNMKYYLNMMEDMMGGFAKNPIVIYMGAIMSLFFGLLIVLFHNVWVWNWPVIITIFGWMGLIKGIWLIFFPKSVSKMMNVYRDKPNVLRISLCVIIVLGIILSIKGYFA
jgi:hypothetical protein